MSYEAGQYVGDYQVVSRLGAGGMGAVYEVRNLITDRLEAMKILLPDLRAAPDLAERFNREIKVHASLVHPNIAALHTAVRVEHQLLMIMELVQGETIAARLRRGPVPFVEAARYVCQVLSALDYAHARGVIHRDIKPANIMVTPHQTIKLMDFGIAATSKPSKPQDRLTAAGTALGSIHYMAPEQVQAGAPDARSDLYSLGVTFYEAVTGRCPIQGSTQFEIMNAHLNVIPLSPGELNPSLPPILSTIILKSLEKRPVDRFQTAADFLYALQPVAFGPQPWLPPNSLTPTATLQEVKPDSAARPAVPPATPLPFDEATLDAATKELAAYIGPIAKIIVKNAAKVGGTRRQFYEALAQEISTPAERSRFLTKLSR